MPSRNQPPKESPVARLERLASALNAVPQAVDAAYSAFPRINGQLRPEAKKLHDDYEETKHRVKELVRNGEAENSDQIIELNSVMYENSKERLVKWKEILRLCEDGINLISEKMDELNSINRNGISVDLTRRYLDAKKRAIYALKELKAASCESEFYVRGLQRLLSMNDVFSLKNKIVGAGETQLGTIDSTALEDVQQLINSYENIVGLVFLDQETALDKSLVDTSDPALGAEARVRSDMEQTLATLCDFRSEKVENLIEPGGKESAIFSDIVAEFDALARYAGHWAIVNPESGASGIREHYEHLAIAYQTQGLLAKANEAAKKMGDGDQELKERLEETTAYFSVAAKNIERCFGEHAKGVRIIARNDSGARGVAPLEAVMEKRKAFPESDKRVALETLAEAYADLSMQYRQFQEVSAGAERKDLFRKMSEEATVLENRLRRVLSHMENVPEVTPESRAEILRKYELEQLAVRPEVIPVVERQEEIATPETTAQRKAEKKKRQAAKRKPLAPVASSAPRVAEAPISQTSRAAESAPSEDQFREDAAVERARLTNRIQSMQTQLNEKTAELTEARKKPDLLQQSPERRNRYSPDELLRSPGLAIKKAIAAARQCRELAANYRRIGELGGDGRKAVEYERLEQTHRRYAATCQTLGETWRIERIKTALATQPDDGMFLRVPDGEVEQIGPPERLPHPVIAKGDKGERLFSTDNQPVYDLVIEDVICLRGGKQFVMHRHFRSTNPDAKKEQLLAGEGKLVAHTLKTIDAARLGRAYKEPKEGVLILRNQEEVRKAAEDAQKRLNGLQASLQQRGRGGM